VTAKEIFISGPLSGFLSSTFGAGQGGDIAVHTQNLTMKNGGTIAVSSFDPQNDATVTGPSGSIAINATGSVNMANGSAITSESNSTHGGNIAVNANRQIFLQNSKITTSVKNGLGDAGNISIDPDFVILKSSSIVANAWGGAGGNINIVAGNFVTDPTSVVDASSQLGIDGNVTIAAPEVDRGRCIGRASIGL